MRPVRRKYSTIKILMFKKYKLKKKSCQYENKKKLQKFPPGFQDKQELVKASPQQVVLSPPLSLALSG